MGFECYTVLLLPVRHSQAASSFTPQSVAKAMCAEWPEICTDDVEFECLQRDSQNVDLVLINKSPLGWIQILIEPNHDGGLRSISLRFAYSNPRTVDELFYDMISWSMRKFGLYCIAMSDVPHEGKEEVDEIDDPATVGRLLGPSIDHNRKLWYLDAQSQEELHCRPGEAISRFILSR